MLTFRRFLRAATLAHAHPFVRDFAHDALHDGPMLQSKSYQDVKNRLSVRRPCREARLGAALAWRTYQQIRRDVVVSA